MGLLLSRLFPSCCSSQSWFQGHWCLARRPLPPCGATAHQFASAPVKSRAWFHFCMLGTTYFVFVFWGFLVCSLCSVFCWGFQPFMPLCMGSVEHPCWLPVGRFCRNPFPACSLGTGGLFCGWRVFYSHMSVMWDVSVTLNLVTCSVFSLESNPSHLGLTNTPLFPLVLLFEYFKLSFVLIHLDAAKML